MALKVGELLAVLNIDESGYIQGLKGSVEAAKKAEKTISQKFDRIGKAFVKVGKSMTKFVTLPLMAVGVVALKNAADFEKQRVAFETLLGSAKRAGKLLNQLEKFAAVTPFQLPGLIEGTKRLIAFGIKAEDVIVTMENLGNAAMGDQVKLDSLTDAFGKVAARGKASMRELNMFLYAGVPIIDALAKGFGVTTEEIFKMSEQGKVTFADVNKALKDLTTGSGMFAGMIAKQSLTLSGLFSTLKDNITLLLKDLGETFMPMLKEVIAKITDWVRMFRELSDGTKKMIVVIAGIAAAAGPVVLIIGKLILAINAMRNSTILATIAQKIFNKALLTNPIFLVVAAVVALGTVIGVLISKLIKKRKAQKEANLEALRARANANMQQTAVEELSNAEKLATVEKLLGLARIEAATETNEKAQEKLLIRIAELTSERKLLKNVIDEETVSENEYANTLEERVNKAMAEATRLGAIFGKTAEEIAKDKISILQSAITEMVEKGIEPGNIVLQGMIDLMRELGITTEEQKVIQTDFYQAMSNNFGIALAARRRFRELWQAEIDKQDEDELAALEKLNEEKKAKTQGWLDFSIGALRYLAEIANSFIQREYAALEKKYSGMTQAEKDYQAFLKAEKDKQYQTLSAEEKREWDLRVEAEESRAKLEEQMEADRKALQIKEAKRNKAFALFEAIMGGAKAIINAYATPPFPVGLILGKLAIVLTGIQIASILAQPIPKAIRGGLVKMIEGGVFQGRPGIDTNAVAVTSGEYIMPPAQTARFANELEQMRKGEFSSEVNIEATPVTIILDSREIGRGVIDFIAAESDKGGVRINPKAIKANT